MDGNLVIKCKGIERDGVVVRSEKKQINQVNSVMTRRIKQYSVLVEDKETKDCFLDFQEIGQEPSFMKKPLTNFQEYGQDPQSSS